MDTATSALVRQRAGNRCEYCRLHQAAIVPRLHIEHVIARQHHGADDPSNLCLACDRCNLHKGPNLTGVDQQTQEIVPLFHPRRDVWSEHFQLRGARIIGRTSKGQVTVDLLQMNSIKRVVLRKHLLAEGKFEYVS